MSDVANPLVAGRVDSTRWYSGLSIVESINDTVDGIESGSWVDSTIGGLAVSLDALATVLDPIGSLVSMGVAWLMEHVKPLSDALDWLAGDPDQIVAYAGTWRNVAANASLVAADLRAAVAREVQEWTGAAADAYRAHVNGQLAMMGGIVEASNGIGSLVEGAGLLVALVRELVRDLIADFVSVLIVRLPTWLAEAGLTLGVATPLVVAQVSSLVAKWAARIAELINGLLRSIRRLTPLLTNLGGSLDEIRAALRQAARSDSTAPSGLVPDSPVAGTSPADSWSSNPAGFPGGSDFIPESSGSYSPEAAAAYEHFRDSPESTSRVAAHTGLDPRIIEGTRQNLFVQQHDVAMGPNDVVRGYFTPQDRIARLWADASNGPLTSDRRQELRMLAAHEYVENRLMQEGIPFRSADPGAFDADGDYVFNRAYPSAHNIAPNEWRPTDPLRHWRTLGLDNSGIELADDLSNLDDVVEAALRGLGR